MEKVGRLYNLEKIRNEIKELQDTLRDKEESIKEHDFDIAKQLELPPQKIHCSVLAEDAIKAAIQNYYARKSSET